MDRIDYEPMKHATFKSVLEEIKLWYTNPGKHKRPDDAELRRVKLHGLTCPECRQHLEETAKENNILSGIVQEIQDEIDCRKEEFLNLISELDTQEKREIVAESMYFFLDLKDAEPPPNSQPSLAFLDPRPVSRTATDSRHAHFERTLDVDGDN